MYPLRVLVSSDEERAKTSLNFWKGALLMKTALTEPAEMLAAKDMVVMEDMAEGALPATTTAHQNQSMTERHIQIGVGAASKLLASLLSGTTADNVAAFAVVDLSPRTGDFGLAVLHAIQDSLVPVHYIACPEDDEHADWLDWWMKHKTAELILTGSLKPTGVLLPPEEPPAEELTCLPPKPTLSALVWADRQGESAAVRLPEDVVAKWSSSAEFTEPMNKLLTSIADVSSDPVVAPPVRQRPRIAEQTRSPAAPGGGSTDAACVVDAIPVSQVPPLVHDIKLLSARVKDLALCVAAPAAPDSGAVFIANRSEADVSIPGRLLHRPVDADRAGRGRPGPHPGRRLQIGQRLLARPRRRHRRDALERAPARKVQYHHLEPDPQPGSPGHFPQERGGLPLRGPPSRQEGARGRRGRPRPGALTGARRVSTAPPSNWDTNRMQIVWTVRYHPAKGLAPVRPQVLLKDSLFVKAQTAVEL